MSQDAETVARQICDGCGHSMTDAEIAAGGFIACCPERKMRDMTFPERSLSARLAEAEAREAGLRDDLETMVNVAAAGGYAGPTGWSFADREAELEKALTAIVKRLAAGANNAPNPEPITDPMAVLVWIGNTAKDALDAIYQARAASTLAAIRAQKEKTDA